MVKRERHGQVKAVKRQRGPEGFEEYYADRYAERWPALRRVLLDSSSLAGEGRVVRENAYAEREARRRLFAECAPGLAPGSFVFDRSQRWDARDAAGLRLGYVMDAASILAARALPLGSAEMILDLCAAPGGKSLILAEGMSETARLFVNDRSPARRKRLAQVLDDYLPPAARERVAVTGHDGRRVGLAKPEAFDAVLLDAPCSSEGHVLCDTKALNEWSSGRVERLAKDQYALLTAALGALKLGGALVYSTCALAPEENDGVIERLLSRGRHPVEVDTPESELGEPGARTKHGIQLLPDADGAGPIYFTRLRKL